MSDTTPGQPPTFPAMQPVVIGLTGSIAAGKSTVGVLLEELGAEVIDADEVYRTLVVPGSSLQRDIVRRFGPGVVRPDGELDRKALGAVVFADPTALRDLDRLTHPAIVAELRRRIAESTAPVVAIEAVKLVQAGMLGDIDALWLVAADAGVRQRRLITRDALSEEEAEARITNASPPLPPGVMPDAIIDNSGDRAGARLAVWHAWRRLIDERAGQGCHGGDRSESREEP